MLDALPDYPDNQRLTTQEAGDLAGRHRRTIVTWIKDSKLPAKQLAGPRGQYWILWKDLRELLEKDYGKAT